MDFNDWVYNFGGIVGLWFGWSALSVTEVIFYFKSIPRKLQIIYFHLKHYFIQRKIFRETKNFSFITIDNKQVLVYNIQQKKKILFLQNNHQIFTILYQHHFPQHSSKISVTMKNLAWCIMTDCDFLTTHDNL